MIFYVTAAILAALNLAGVASISWWLIAAVALIPFALVAVISVGALVAVVLAAVFGTLRVKVRR